MIFELFQAEDFDHQISVRRLFCHRSLDSDLSISYILLDLLSDILVNKPSKISLCGENTERCSFNCFLTHDEVLTRYDANLNTSQALIYYMLKQDMLPNIVSGRGILIIDSTWLVFMCLSAWWCHQYFECICFQCCQIGLYWFPCYSTN